MPKFRQKGDYSRAEEYLDEISEEIEFEHGAKFGELSASEQREALLDHFFKGIPQYERSAEQMRRGISITTALKGAITSIGVVNLRGKHHTILRDVKTGRIKKWID